MDKTNILTKVKELFFGEEKFIDAKSGDLILRVKGEEFVVDAPIFTITEEGDIQTNDGSYTLEDGRILTVENGIITKIDEPVVEETPAEEFKEEVPVEEPIVEEKPEEVPTDNKEVEDLKAKIAEMEIRFDEIENALSQLIDYSKNVNTKINEFTKNTPADTETINFKKETGKKETKKDILDDIRSLRSKK